VTKIRIYGLVTCDSFEIQRRVDVQKSHAIIILSALSPYSDKE
jgi:hypothetical protein